MIEPFAQLYRVGGHPRKLPCKRAVVVVQPGQGRKRCWPQARVHGFFFLLWLSVLLAAHPFIHKKLPFLAVRRYITTERIQEPGRRNANRLPRTRSSPRVLTTEGNGRRSRTE